MGNETLLQSGSRSVNKAGEVPGADFLEHLIGAAQKAEKFMLAEFGSLRADQLNWTHDTESWSIGQCLDHIVVTDTLYFPDFEKIMEGSYRMNFWEKFSPFSNLFGKMLVNQVSEIPTRKFKSPRSFRPAPQPVGIEIITRFSKHQDTLVAFMQAVKPEQLRKLRISSPASPFVTYNLQQALQMMVQHQYRHLNQAIRVKTRTGFPH